MSEIVDRLRQAATKHHGTDLGGLLQWAALHIQSQDEALNEAREELSIEERERLRLEASARHAKQAVEAALKAINESVSTPIEFGRDVTSHINLMAAHGDQDYLKTNGMSIRHVDCRETKPRARKSKP